MCARWDTSNLSQRRSLLSDLTVCIVLHPVVSFTSLLRCRQISKPPCTAGGRTLIPTKKLCWQLFEYRQPSKPPCTAGGRIIIPTKQNVLSMVRIQATIQATLHGRWKDTRPTKHSLLCISSLFDMTSYRHCIPRLTHANMLCVLPACAGSMWCLVAAIVTSVSPLGYDNKLFRVHREVSLYKTSNVCMCMWPIRMCWNGHAVLVCWNIFTYCGTYCCYVSHAQCYLP